MKKIQKADYLAYISGVVTAVTALFVMVNVRFYGDDYHYLMFSKMPTSEFWNAHLDHYMKDNGRAFVHILDTVFLGMPPVIWQVLNSVLLGMFVFCGAKIIMQSNTNGTSGGDDAKVINSRSAVVKGAVIGIILASAVLCLDIYITRQSVYWITGSFNYVYPFAVFMLFWLCISKVDYGKLNMPILCVLGFVSAASTEQNAMMTIGLCVLYLLHKWIFGKKLDKRLLFVTIIVIIGGLTVFLAPATFVRTQLENKEQVTLAAIVVQNLKVLYSYFIATPRMLYYMYMSILASVVYLFKKKKKFAAYIAPVIAVALYFEATDTSGLFTVMRLVRAAVIVVFLVAVLLLSLKKQLAEGQKLSSFAVILCVGSQIMMLISPVYGERNMLCAIFLLMIYSAATFALCFSTEKMRGSTKVILAVLMAAIAIFSSNKMYNTINGYRINRAVDEENIRLIGEYRAGEQLCQYKLIDEAYGWSMPYYSKYHLNRYKIYYNIEENTDIEWLMMR